MTAVFLLQGVNESLEVYEDKVILSPKGLPGSITKGMKGAKTIPFSSITAIQFKEAGAMFAGFMQFSVLGNDTKQKGYSIERDENAIMFVKRNNGLAHNIRDFVERSICDLRPAMSIADEIQKLANLKGQGFLSDEEFKAAKEKLIS